MKLFSLASLIVATASTADLEFAHPTGPACVLTFDGTRLNNGCALGDSFKTNTPHTFSRREETELQFVWGGKDCTIAFTGTKIETDCTLGSGFNGGSGGSHEGAKVKFEESGKACALNFDGNRLNTDCVMGSGWATPAPTSAPTNYVPCREASYDGSASMGPSSRYFSNPFGTNSAWEKKFNTNTKHYLTYKFASPRQITKATMNQYGRSCSSISSGCCEGRGIHRAFGKTVHNFCADHSGNRYSGYSGAFCYKMKIQFSDDGSYFRDADTWPAQVGDNTFTWSPVGAHRWWRLKCDDTSYKGGNPNQWQGRGIGLYEGMC